MKKNSKLLVALVLVIVMMVSLFSVTAGAASVGDVIGYSQPTDIIATINGYQLESYNVEDLTYICVEDLRHYGFDVNFDMDSRTLSFSRNYEINQIDPQKTNPDFLSIGNNQIRHNILYTDIVTYANGEYVAGYNINGKTIINFDELGRFGTVSYDNNKREISLVMDDVNTNMLAIYTESLQEESDKVYNKDWIIRYRAKGDVMILIGTARTYLSAEILDLFITNIIPQDKQDAQELLYQIKSYGIPVSAVYVEYKNADGTQIISYQTN